jgi:hypothetical protein
VLEPSERLVELRGQLRTLLIAFCSVETKMRFASCALPGITLVIEAYSTGPSRAGSAYLTVLPLEQCTLSRATIASALLLLIWIFITVSFCQQPELVCQLLF